MSVHVISQASVNAESVSSSPRLAVADAVNYTYDMGWSSVSTSGGSEHTSKGPPSVDSVKEISSGYVPFDYAPTVRMASPRAPVFAPTATEEPRSGGRRFLTRHTRHENQDSHPYMRSVLAISNPDAVQTQTPDNYERNHSSVSHFLASVVELLCGRFSDGHSDEGDNNVNGNNTERDSRVVPADVSMMPLPVIAPRISTPLPPRQLTVDDSEWETIVGNEDTL